MIYSVEIFETKNRMLGTAIAMSVSLMFMSLWIWIKEQLIDFDLNPTLALIPFSIVSFASTFLLKETEGVELV